MPIKTILVPLYDAQGASAALAATFALARSFGAHVSVLHLRNDPTRALGDFVGESVSPALVEEILTSAEARAKSAASKTRRAFDDAVRRAKIPVGGKGTKSGASASYDEVVGQSDAEIERRGRLSDLVVVRRARGNSDVGARVVAETALMGTGRPLLVVPPKAPAKIGSNVAIAWNDSTEAAKAVAAALPFLGGAAKVTVISARENGAEYDQDGLIAYLRHHGVRARGASVRAGGDAGQAIARAASRAGANLLVMGAYTHSRVREMILGGVTQHVLSKSRIPVLMAH